MAAKVLCITASVDAPVQPLTNARLNMILLLENALERAYADLDAGAPYLGTTLRLRPKPAKRQRLVYESNQTPPGA